MRNESYLQFRRPESHCLLCDKQLPPGGRHPSTLHLTPRDEAVRQDFCPECWQKMEQRDYFSFWIAKRTNAIDPARRRLERAERNDALWRLFTALHATRTDDMAPQVFLLAHLLMKYRVLEFRGRNEAGSLLFYHNPTQETFEVVDVPVEEVSFVEARNIVEDHLASAAAQPAEGGGEEPPE